MLRAGQLTAGHARAVLSAADPDALARRIIAEGLNVRAAEALARRSAQVGSKTAPRPATGKSADTLALERTLSDKLVLHVQVADKDGAGEVRIRYASLEQLDDLCRRLGAG